MIDQAQEGTEVAIALRVGWMLYGTKKNFYDLLF
jgi:hypothetical protein